MDVAPNDVLGVPSDRPSYLSHGPYHGRSRQHGWHSSGPLIKLLRYTKRKPGYFIGQYKVDFEYIQLKTTEQKQWITREKSFFEHITTNR